MAKNSFILYHDQKEVIDELDDEQAGKLIKAIYEYNVNKKLTLTGALKLVFIPFKNSFDRNDDKWDDIVKKRSEAGKKGMEKRWKAEQNITNDNKCYQTITNITDSVSVSVSDSVSVINIDYPRTHTEVFDFCFFLFPNCVEKDLENSCKKFYNYYQEKKWTGVNDWKVKAEIWVQDDIKNKKIKVIDTSRRL